MKVYVDNFSGKNIGLIEVGYTDTVLAIKEKIWRCLRIPVSSQILYFKSKMLLKDHAKASQLKIVTNSHLQVYVASNRNHPTHKTNQVLHETKNSPAPSNSTQQIVHGHQDLPVGRKRNNNSQVLQTEQSPVLPSNSIGQDLLSVIKMPSVRPMTTQKISNVQDSPVMARSKNKQVLQTEQPLVQPCSTEEISEVQSFWPERTNEIIDSQSRPLSEIEMLLGIQECFPSATVGSSSNMNQVFQTEQFSPKELDFVKEILNIPDSPAKKRIKTSPMKLTVMVKPTEDIWRIPVEVNADDNVKELRKELVKMPSVRPMTTQKISNVQDSSVMARSKNKQVLQTEQPLVQPWPTEEISEVQSFWPERTNEIIDSQSRPLSEIEMLLGIQECFPSATVGSSSNTNQVFQTEEFSPKELDFVKEILNIPDSPAKKRIKTSPMKLTVMVKPTEDTWRIPVEVNADDNVKELRKELVKMQERGELNVPQEGFFLLYQDTILNENESFSSNGVIQYGTIEIFGEYFTSDDDSTTTGVSSFGH